MTDSLDGYVPAHLRDDRYDEAPPWPADEDTLVALADLVRSMRASGKRVLVHCAAGMNRSGLLSAASLIRDGWSADDAMEAVRDARHGALNNPEFVDLLRRL